MKPYQLSKLLCFATIMALAACKNTEKTTTNTPKPLNEKQIGYLKYFIQDTTQSQQFNQNLLQKIENQQLKIYKDPYLTQQLDFKEFIKTYNHTDTLTFFNAQTGQNTTQINQQILDPKAIVAYKIAANINIKNAQLNIENHAIAPMVTLQSDGITIGEIPLFWLNYADVELK